MYVHISFAPHRFISFCFVSFNFLFQSRFYNMPPHTSSNTIIHHDSSFTIIRKLWCHLNNTVLYKCTCVVWFHTCTSVAKMCENLVFTLPYSVQEIFYCFIQIFHFITFALFIESQYFPHSKLFTYHRATYFQGDKLSRIVKNQNVSWIYFWGWTSSKQ